MNIKYPVSTHARSKYFTPFPSPKISIIFLLHSSSPLRFYFSPPKQHLLSANIFLLFLLLKKYFLSPNIFLLFILRFLLLCKKKIFSSSEYFPPFPSPFFLSSAKKYIFLLPLLRFSCPLRNIFTSSNHFFPFPSPLFFSFANN